MVRGAACRQCSISGQASRVAGTCMSLQAFTAPVLAGAISRGASVYWAPPRPTTTLEPCQSHKRSVRSHSPDLGAAGQCTLRPRCARSLGQIITVTCAAFPRVFIVCSHLSTAEARPKTLLSGLSSSLGLVLDFGVGVSGECRDSQSCRTVAC